MSTFVWFLLGVIYFVLLVTLGLTTLRKGHMFLFLVGIIFPFLWLIGALMAPTPRAAGAQYPAPNRFMRTLLYLIWLVRCGWRMALLYGRVIVPVDEVRAAGAVT